MGRVGVLVAVVAALLISASAAAAAQSWDPGTLTGVSNTPLPAWSGPGRVTTVYSAGGEVDAIVSTPGGGGAPTTQTLQASDAAYPAISGSAQSGAVAAWDDESHGTIDIAEQPPGQPLAATISEGGSGAPVVSTDDAGDAAVGYETTDAGQQAAVVVRSPDGSWSSASELDPVVGGDQVVKSIAVSEDGEVVIGWLDGATPMVSIDSGGVISTQVLGAAVGEDVYETQYYNMLKVGIDAAGDAVVVWGEPDSGIVDSLEIAFRAAGSETFGAAQPVGDGILDTEQPQFAVSGPGEVVLVFAGEIANANGTATGDDLRAAFGNAGAGKLGPLQILDEGDESQLSLGMNRRGDAVLITQQFDFVDTPEQDEVQARTRAPLGGWSAPSDALAPALTPHYGRYVGSASVDAYGNGLFAWTDQNAGTAGTATTTPLSSTQPPAVTLPAGYIAGAAQASGGTTTTTPTTTNTTPTTTATTTTPASLPTTTPTKSTPTAQTPSGSGITLSGIELGRTHRRIVVTVGCAAGCSLILSGELTGPHGARIGLSTARFRAPGARSGPVTFTLTKAARTRLGRVISSHQLGRWHAEIDAIGQNGATASSSAAL